ncbi:MAG: DUF58 domain-containing protein [Pseudomonadota bacterium]
MRHIDWRVTARRGKAHTKLFHEERKRAVFLWVDYRAPIFFATQGVFKSVFAARCATLLAWSANHHNDRIGGLITSPSTFASCSTPRQSNFFDQRLSIPQCSSRITLETNRKTQ